MVIWTGPGQKGAIGTVRQLVKGSALIRRIRWNSLKKQTQLYAPAESVQVFGDGSVEKTLLIGGFGGSWNFGDIAQLQGAIDYHRSRHPSRVAVPVLPTGNVKSQAQLRKIQNAFGTEHVLLVGSEPPCRELQAEALQSVQATHTLHFYGGGQLNRFWAGTRLPVVERLHEACKPERYLVTGQQIEPALADTLAQHFEVYRPSIVGCRDKPSIDALQSAGVPTLDSGDDSWEIFVAARQEALSAEGGQAATLAVQIGFPEHVFRQPEGSDVDADRKKAAALYDHALEAAVRAVPSDADLVVLNAYRDDRDYLSSGASERFTRAGEMFPLSRSVDLPALQMAGKLGSGLREAFRNGRPQFFIGTYYHPTLLFLCLGVPSYLFSLNDFYRQKAQALEIPKGSAEEFFAISAEQHEERLASFRARHDVIRRDWLGALDACESVAAAR